MSFLRSVPTSIANLGGMKISPPSIQMLTRQKQTIRNTTIRCVFSSSAEIGTPTATATVTTAPTRCITTNPSLPVQFEDYKFNDTHYRPRGMDYRNFSTSMDKSGSSSKDSKDIDYDGVPDDVAKLINDHAKHPPTSVSLQALMRTGRGEYLDRHFENVAIKEHTATELVLMQVASFLRRELPIRLAHRVQDLEKVSATRDGRTECFGEHFLMNFGFGVILLCRYH